MRRITSTLYAVEVVFRQRPQRGLWFGINAAYQLVGIGIAAVVVTVWS